MYLTFFSLRYCVFCFITLVPRRGAVEQLLFHEAAAWNSCVSPSKLNLLTFVICLTALSLKLSTIHCNGHVFRAEAPMLAPTFPFVHHGWTQLLNGSRCRRSWQVDSRLLCGILSICGKLRKFRRHVRVPVQSMISYGIIRTLKQID